ncbi:MAG: hypothetical protein ACKOET_14680 [Verrucomicrobiota bacterium]
MRTPKDRSFLPPGDKHLPTNPERRVFVGTWIPADQHRALKQIAKANHRSLCGQIAYELHQKFAQG